MRIHLLDGLLFLLMQLSKSLDKRETDLVYFDPGAVRNIFVVSSTAIGDTLLSTPAIRAVRERYPHAHIIAHFNIKNMELFENNPHIDDVIPYYGGYKKFLRTIREIRKHKFDLVLIFHGNEPQATPMAYLSGARFILKLPNTSEYRFLLSNKDRVIRWQDFSHGVEQRLEVAKMAGCTVSDIRMVLPVTDEGMTRVDSFLKQNGVSEGDVLMGFQVGASTVSRMWFADRFIELGKRLINAGDNIKILITGSPREYTYCREIAEAIGMNVLVSAGRMPLQFVPALLKRLRVLVTGDTGMMHMAIAVGTPVVALFAVSDARRSGPYYDREKHKVIQREKTCEPCISKKCTYQRCMENISVDEVFRSAIDVIRNSVNTPLFENSL